MSPPGGTRPNHWNTQQAASRPLKILEAVSGRGPGTSAQQIVAATGIPAPSVYRLVGCLVDDGYLVRTDDPSGLRLGPKVAPMANNYTEQLASRAVLEAVHRAGDHTPDLIVAAVHTQGRFIVDTAHEEVLGEPDRWHAGALGKLLVAYRRDLLARLTFTPFTPRTHRTLAALVTELDEVVANRVSLERQEVREGQCGVAVAVTDDEGNLAGALCVTGVTEPRLGAVADWLLDLAGPMS